MVIGVNCGHTISGAGRGATGYIDESRETRTVGRPLMRMLKELGHTVIDCTEDYADSTSDNLKKICALANEQPLDMFLSIHFNAGGGLGTEVFTIEAKDVAKANKIKTAICNLGFKDRGIKDGSHLYVLKHTNAPSVLIEVCFVDNWADVELYGYIGSEKIASAICEAITGSLPNNTTEDLTVTQYEELKLLLNDIKARLEKIESPMIYNYIDNNMPDWAKPTIQNLVDKGVLKGDEGGLNLTEDLMRVLVINDRMGLYD